METEATERRRGQFVAEVRTNLPLCREHYRLTLALPSFPPTVPGQFVQLACRDLAQEYSPELDTTWSVGSASAEAGEELVGPLALLRRPFSLAGREDGPGGVELDVIHRVVGVGTDWLSRLRPTDAVHLIGPLGNGFALPPEDGVALLVGGGVGIPPMLYLARHLVGRKAVAFCGATSIDLLALGITANAPKPGPRSIEPLYNVREFAEHGLPAVVTTDDGSYGFRGYVTAALEQYLDRFFPDTWAVGSVRPTIYTCGPEGMMKAVATLATKRGLTCQVAVERAMACGMGTCQSCVIKLRTEHRPDGRNWAYKLACTDGPIFRAADLLW